MSGLRLFKSMRPSVAAGSSEERKTPRFDSAAAGRHATCKTCDPGAKWVIIMVCKSGNHFRRFAYDHKSGTSASERAD
jgi:hypothetical protein